MLKEFREFALRGNVLDMAVGIVIGAAFGTIVQSLVNDVIMPPIGLILGGVDFSEFFFVLSPVGQAFPTLAAAGEAGAVTINYGRFINSVISFAIVAFALFMVIRAFNRLKRTTPPAPVAPPPPSKEELLLAEIRDLLRAGRP
jgi:large conductance mechanosensitive channel